MEMQQSRRLQNDGRTENTRPNEKRAQTGDESICSAQVGRPLAAAIQDQQLMPEQRGFSNYAA
jgi:hypothetical protein